MKIDTWLTFAVAPVVAGSLILAQPALGEGEHRQHGAHEHGKGVVSIALEGEQLTLDLSSPAINIIGFEHKPHDDEQKAAVEDAVSALKAPDTLFKFPTGAACSLEEARVETSLAEHDSDHAEHNEAGEEDHEAHHEDGDEEHESHADIDAEYSYICKNPAALTYIDVLLFERFPGAEKLEAQYVTEKGQGASSLNAQSTRVQF